MTELRCSTGSTTKLERAARTTSTFASSSATAVSAICATGSTNRRS
jgi:hypothetical protein